MMGIVRSSMRIMIGRGIARSFGGGVRKGSLNVMSRSKGVSMSKNKQQDNNSNSSTSEKKKHEDEEGVITSKRSDIETRLHEIRKYNTGGEALTGTRGGVQDLEEADDDAGDKSMFGREELEALERSGALEEFVRACQEDEYFQTRIQDAIKKKLQDQDVRETFLDEVAAAPAYTFSPRLQAAFDRLCLESPSIRDFISLREAASKLEAQDDKDKR